MTAMDNSIILTGQRLRELAHLVSEAVGDDRPVEIRIRPSQHDTPFPIHEIVASETTDTRDILVVIGAQPGLDTHPSDTASA